MRVSLNLFPNRKRRALTLSYDDGRLADRRLVQIMDRHGIRGTFHLNSGSLVDASHVGRSEVRSLYGSHEVSVHTVSHPRLDHIPREGVIQEILDDRRALEDLAGYPVRGMSFPFGSYTPEVVDYLRAVRELRFSASGTIAHNPSASSVWVERDGTPIEIRGGSTVHLSAG